MRRRLLLGAGLLLVAVLALLVLGRPSTAVPAGHTRVERAEVGGPAALPAATAPATAPPGRSDAGAEADDADAEGTPPTRTVPRAPDAPADAADGRLEGPTDTDPPTYTLDGVGMQAAFDDLRDLRETCLDELPAAPRTPATLTATVQVVDAGGVGRVDAVYLPDTTEDDGPMIACLARTLARVHFEQPRRERIGLTATWTLGPP
ncbi:MAG: hypothetical protein H6732_03330 [Alphaproteobacteria bacterium]|nr:hypothetical protein [Alphaproteobacteria bacterium]